MKPLLVLLALAGSLLFATAQEPSKPLRLGVAGLVHGHVVNILRHLDRPDIQVVGIAEPDEALSKSMAEKFHFDPAIAYPGIEAMLDAAKPEAVAVFTSIRDHLPIIRACARRGIPVMVEKPLALNAEEAREIAKLAQEHHIPVLTNYETTWYPTTQEAERVARRGDIGEIRKMVAHDGHRGPKEISVPPEFLSWLIDPAGNGGGAIIDFGCYGANLMTWIMKGARPDSVTAVTRQFKTDPAYAKVDDEATIILSYPKAQGLIEASWNWPYDRKDLEVYGTAGAAFSDDRTHWRERRGLKAPEKARELPLSPAPLDDPFTYFAAVVRGKVDPKGSPSSLENNLVVMEILDAARESAKSGRAVPLVR